MGHELRRLDAHLNRGALPSELVACLRRAGQTRIVDSDGFCRTNSVERRWLPHPVVAMLGRGVSVLGKAGSHSAHTTSEHRGAGRQTPIVDSDRRFRRILSNGFCQTHSVELHPSMCSFAPRTSHIFGLNLNVSHTPAYGGPLACGVARHFVKPAPRYAQGCNVEFENKRR